MKAGVRAFSPDECEFRGLHNMPPEADFLPPIHVPLKQGSHITGESIRSLYDAIAKGELTAFKFGPRTMLAYAELKERCAARPVGLRKNANPNRDAGRDAFLARRKKQAARCKHKRT
jgi:hypothetical protein